MVLQSDFTVAVIIRDFANIWDLSESSKEHIS